MLNLIKVTTPRQDEALGGHWVLRHGSDSALPRFASRLLPALLRQISLLLPAPTFPLLFGLLGLSLRVGLDRGRFAVVFSGRFLNKFKRNISSNFDII